MTETRAARPRGMWASLALLPLLALALAGSSPAEAAPEEPSRAGPQGPEGDVPGFFLDADQELVALTAGFPSFGGYYIGGAEGEPERLVVLLTEPNVSVEEAHAIRSVLARYTGRLGMERMPVEVREVEHRFADLKLWHDKVVEQVWSIDGVVSTGVNELTNRVLVRFDETMTDEAAIRAGVERANVPQGAVAVKGGYRHFEIAPQALRNSAAWGGGSELYRQSYFRHPGNQRCVTGIGRFVADC